jgi:HNH endonuclease
MKKLVVNHRPFRMPTDSLASPRTTEHKMLSEGHCRMCQRPHAVRPLTRHHLIPVAWFLRQPMKLRLVRNAHANIVPLCREDHDRVDSRFNDVRIEARRHLRRCLSQAEIAFCIQVVGLEWLNENYPVLEKKIARV